MSDNIRKLEGNVKAFAEACYSDNSIEELRRASYEAPDLASCISWGLSLGEYFDAITAAYKDRVADAEGGEV